MRIVRLCNELRHLMRNRKKSSSIVELDGRVSNLAVATRKPFDMLVEGLISENSRGDKTPLELFLSDVATWPRVLALAAETLMASSDT